MSWSTAFEALMPDTVTVKALASWSTDGYGTPTWSTGTAYTARVVVKQTQVVDANGVEEVSTSHAWLASTSTFSASDQFFVNGSTTETKALSVESYPDEDGLHHGKVYFG